VGLQRELADAYQRIAQVQNSGLGANVGDTRGSLESYGKALTIRQSLAARDPVEPQDLFGLALVEFELGTLQRATGELARAEESFLSTASRFEVLAGEEALPDRHRRLAAVYQRLAEVQTFQGKRDAALRWAEKAHSEAEAGWRERPEDPASRSGLAAASYELAAAQAALGQYAEALERTRFARTLLEAGLRENPLDAHQIRVLLYVLHGEAEYLRTLGSLPDAVRVREQALSIAEEAWRRDPADRWSQTGVAVAANQLGNVLLEANDVEESVRRFRQALHIAAQAVEEDPRYDFARLEAASAEYGLGRALLTVGEAGTVAEGCAALHRVHSFWSGRRSENALPSNESEELDGLADWLARCPSAR
jgi:tetratricopeptide (TPR) repeat protein